MKQTHHPRAGRGFALATFLAFLSGSAGALLAQVSIDGNNAGAEVTVDDGDAHSATRLMVAPTAGTSGTLTIDGTGTTYDFSDVATIGVSGTGRVNVTNNGSLSVAATAGGLTVGHGSGSTGVLYVDAGGRVVTTDYGLTVGSQAGSVGQVTLTGAGTTAQVAGFANIGRAGTGTLDILQGASMYLGPSPSRTDLIGYFGIGTMTGTAGSPGGVVNVSGANSSLNIAGLIQMGGYATDGYSSATGYGTLTIADDAYVNTPELHVLHGAVTISGGGLDVANHLHLYADGTLTLDSGYLNSSTTTIDGGTATFNSWVGLNAWNNPAAEWNVLNGGQLVQNAGLGIGNNAGHTATLNVTGPGSAVTGEGNVNVGWEGTGTVNVTGGATFRGGYVDIGHQPGSHGTVNVDGNGSTFTSTRNIAVGNQSTGTLNVTGGAVVRTETTGTDGVIFAGYGTGSNGTLTVSGAGSTLSAQTELIIGHGGTGVATVDNGAHIESRTNALTLGTFAGAEGTLTVTGGGTTGSFDPGALGGFVSSIGNEGTGTLNVLDGAQVGFGRSVNLANATTAHGTLIVDGAGSNVTIANTTTTRTANLNVGWVGEGTVEIRNGGSINVRDQVRIGGGGAIDSSAAVGHVLVTGDGSHLDAGGAILVGLGGTASLTIADNAWVSAAEVEVENAAVTLSGSNPGLNVANGLYLRSGGTLTASGGYLNSSYTTIDGGSATFNQWVGLNAWDGPVAEWNVLNGGQLVHNAGLGIGNNAGHTATLNVTGIDSVVTGAGNISVGWQGTGTVNVTGGATFGGVYVDIGNDTGSHGTVNVDGSGSTVAATRNLVIGNRGTGTLNVTDGATARTQGDGPHAVIFAGYDAGSNGTITVNGAGSTLSAQTELIVGHRGAGDVTIENGAHIESRELALTIGTFAGAEGTLTVTGSGSTGSFDANAYGSFGSVIGNGGTGTLNMLDGAKATFGRSLTLGNLATGDGTLIVDGAGSSVTVTNAISATANLNVGWTGAGELKVRNGGAITVRDGVRIGGNGAAPDAVGDVLVTGANSSLAAGSTVSVGLSGTGSLAVENGGHLTTAGALRIGVSGGTGSVTVTGAGSRVEAGTFLDVGYADYFIPETAGHGTLTVSAGGEVQADHFDIAWRPGTSGSATITGAGSRLVVATDLGVGEGTANASLLVTDGARAETATFTQHRGNVTVSAGGTLAASGTASIAKSGVFTLDAGTLSASALTNAGTVRGSGMIDAATVTNAGTLDVSGATDQLVLTGDYRQTSTGTLRTGLELGNGDGALAHLVAGGNIGLGGTLDVVHSGYEAQLGDTIEILRSTGAGATLTGGFTRINNIDVSDTMSLETQFANGAFNLVVMAKATTEEVFSGTRSGNVDLVGEQTVTGPITLGGDAGRSGSLTLTSGASITTDSTITVGGSGGGSLIVGSGASLSTTDTVSIGGSGALSLTNGGTLSAGSLTSDGVIGGSGTITAGLFTNNGILGPGNSPGSITLDGDVVQTAAGLTLIEISGAIAGTEYDFIHVTGNLTLDGTLEFTFLGDFNPVNGQTFTPLTWDGTLTLGSNFALTGLTQANGWTLTATFLDHSLLVTAVSAIPEPATYATLAGLGVLGLALWRRRRLRA